MSDTVRDVIDRETQYGLADAVEALHVLGIDPDMPIETLRRRLSWGERFERCGPYQTPGSDLIRYEEDGVEYTTTAAWRLYLYIDGL